MDLPQMPSRASPTSPNNIQLIADSNRARTPISKRLLSASSQEPQFAIIPSTSHYQPSCKREEARTLQNLRRRVQALRVVQDNRLESVEATNASKSTSSYSQLDNRPQLFQKILSTKPVSMVLDASDIQTAWQDSDFITDCLCWHNVYRQRHSSPPLTMSSETLSDEDFEKLRCNKCNGYLNRPPIMAFIEMENYLECGRCFDEEAAKAKGLHPLRNKPLEILASLTLFPCKNAKNGCTERRTWPAVEEHEKECVLKWINCIFPTLDIGEFKGTLDDFKTYIKGKWPKLFIDDGLLPNNFNEAFENYYFMFQSNVLSCVRVKCDIIQGKVWFNVCVLEDKTENEYSIEFTSVTSKTLFIIKHACVISLDDFLDLDKAFELSLEAIKQLLKIPNDMRCKIFVNRKFPAYHKAELLKEIQCPVCWDLMHEKIFMCKNGHNVCIRCKFLLTHCPECREDDISIRNISMEKLIAHSFLPCRNYSFGCAYIGTITELIYHLKHCEI